MFSKFWPYNTLRNQILIGFMLVMTIVLFVFGINTYSSVSELLTKSAAKHIQETAVQANGRLDALIGQMDTLTAQIMTDTYVQELLQNNLNGNTPDFSQRQKLARTVGHYQTYSKGVNRIELYTMDYLKLFPLDEQRLDNRVKKEWIWRADDLKGRPLWIGLDPDEPDHVLSLRRISLVDRWFSSGGYLLVSMDRSVFVPREPSTGGNQTEALVLMDPQGLPIISNLTITPDQSELLRGSSPYVTMNGIEYMMISQKSSETGWSLIILTPMQEVTKGISVLRNVLLISGLIGFLLFLLLSYLVSSLITRPILRLIKTMRGARDGILKRISHGSRTMELQELNYTYNQMADNINELIRLVYEKELLQSQTELKALQAQINPHFLYNTLEALYWSLSDKGEDELADLVIALSHIFRYVISATGRQEWVTIRDELEHIERYLQIMKSRLGSRLDWSIDSVKEYGNVPVPKLIIQPLVENAIVHGIEKRVRGGTLRVRIEPSPERSHLKVTIEDDGTGIEETVLKELLLSITTGTSIGSKRTGLGIRNVKRRLELYYGVTAGELTIESLPGVGTTVRFEIPIERETYDENNTNRTDRG
ncbi:cache domain-containing sensor histidine kinase [Paenibacillus planticolens]|uniref:histidine kinase n=1 Tax=Paenibacillus planticolens TaxID=2654976 RepID=A0ABX1ZFQ9_9BACL|nr:sensor histidine kinase [Paenibacillus planticolens]NOU98928.1 HAMP domain-containing protein [Paenibacillus planticolens]